MSFAAKKKDEKKRGAPSKRGRQRKPAEKAIAKEVQEVVPESQQYSQLLEFEKRLDAALIRKRMDVQDLMMRKPNKIKRILRLFISNTHAHQPLPGDVGDDTNPPEWTLRIEGRLLDDPTTKADLRSKRRFSTFVNRLYVEFDRSQYLGEDNFVEWHRSSSQAISDGFEITRRGSVPVRTTVLLDMEAHPPRYKLAPALAETLGTVTATRMDAVLQLWEYIKINGLQDPQEREYFKCDPHLRRALRTDRMKFSEVAQALNHLLLPADPLVFYYELSLDPLVPRKQQVYDIEIETDDGLRNTLNNFMLHSSWSADLKSLDDQIQGLTEELKQCRAKRDFMMSFHQDPEQFTAAWVASQARELSTQAAVTALPEAQRYASFYSKPWVENAVQRYFSSVATEARVAAQIHQQELPR